jgi:hypothetical protein
MLYLNWGSTNASLDVEYALREKTGRGQFGPKAGYGTGGSGQTCMLWHRMISARLPILIAGRPADVVDPFACQE